MAKVVDIKSSKKANKKKQASPKDELDADMFGVGNINSVVIIHDSLNDTVDLGSTPWHLGETSEGREYIAYLLLNTLFELCNVDEDLRDKLESEGFTFISESSGDE